MSAGSPFDHIAELSRWLAEANIDSLELSGPEGRLYLKRCTGDRYETADANASAADQPGGETHVVLTAHIAGILCHSHPMQEAPLAAEGSKVQPGQVLALLQVGALLVPVLAPHEGYVGAMKAEEGTLIGFGDPVVEFFSGESSGDGDGN